MFCDIYLRAISQVLMNLVHNMCFKVTLLKTLPHLPGTRDQWVNTLRPRQNGRHFADDTFNRIFVNENVRISIKFSLKFVPKGPINNIPALVQIMAWRRPGDKPLSEPVTVSLLTYIYASLGLNELNKCVLVSTHQRYNTWWRPNTK